MSTPIEHSPLHREPASGWLEKLPSLFRAVGIAAILMSLYGFFARGWEGSDDLTRFLMLFAHTVGLAGISLLTGHFLKEGKGARILMMLTLVSVVANFSILGSFLYAEYGNVLGSGFVAAMKWNLNSEMLTVLLSIVVPLVLTPIVLIAFRVLARGMSRKMSVLFLASNVVLLFPLRDPFFIAIFSIILAAYTLFLVIKNQRQQLEAKTREGRFALLIQFAPLTVMLVRNIWLYHDDSILYASACVVAFIALRQFSLMIAEKSIVRGLAEIASAMICFMLWVCMIDVIDDLFSTDAFVISVPALIASVFLYELSLRSKNLSGFCRNTAVVVTVFGTLFNLLMVDAMVATLICLVMGGLMLFQSYHSKHRTLFIGGLILVASALIKLTWSLWFVFDFNAWIATAIIGTLAIIAGSMLESKGSVIKQKLQHYQASLSQWHY